MRGGPDAGPQHAPEDSVFVLPEVISKKLEELKFSVQLTKEFLIATSGKGKKDMPPCIRLALHSALDPLDKFQNKVSMEDINLSDLTYNNDGKIQLGPLRRRAVIFHAASRETLEAISRNESGESIKHVTVTVGTKPFNLPLTVGMSRSTSGGHGRGPLRKNLEDCKLIIEHASNVPAALDFLRKVALEKSFHLEVHEGEPGLGFGPRSFSMRIEKGALSQPLFNRYKDTSSTYASDTQRFPVRPEDSTEMRYCAFAHPPPDADVAGADHCVFTARIIVFSEARAHNKAKKALRKQQQENAKPGAAARGSASAAAQAPGANGSPAPGPQQSAVPPGADPSSREAGSGQGGRGQEGSAQAGSEGERNHSANAGRQGG